MNPSKFESESQTEFQFFDVSIFKSELPKKCQNLEFNFDSKDANLSPLLAEFKLTSPPMLSLCYTVYKLYIMHYQSNRQLAGDVIHQAFLVSLVAEGEAQLLQDAREPDYTSSESPEHPGSSSSSSSESSSDDEPLLASDALLDVSGQLWSKHYFTTQELITKDSNQLYLLLHDYKINWPEIFRLFLHISPGCFDAAAEVIKDDEIFHNNSNNPQMPVKQQLAIALYCFGHYGNAASTMKVALWAGVGFGTVPLVTKQVMKALNSEHFHHLSVHWPSAKAKEIAKTWTEEASYPAWHDGW